MIFAPGEESDPREEAEERALSWLRLLIWRNSFRRSFALPPPGVPPFPPPPFPLTVAWGA